MTPPTDSSGPAAYLLVGALWLAPPIGLVVAVALRLRGTRLQQLGTLCSGVASIVVATAVLATQWSFAGKLADYAVVASAYLGYCVLVTLGPLLLRRKWLAVSTLVMGMVPVGLGYTPYGLFVAAVSAQAATALEVPMPQGACRAMWDWPLGDIQHFEIVWRPAFAPFVERRVETWRMSEAQLTLTSMRGICDQRRSSLAR